MVSTLLGTLLILLVVSYYALKIYHKKSSGQSGIICDRTEDRGFYDGIDPKSLHFYQSALDKLFYILDVPYFDGAIVPSSMREAVGHALEEAAENPQVNPMYLRVMLCQFLQADAKLRCQDEVRAHWAERVYCLDIEGSHSGTRGIPSAWKVHFKGSLNTEAIFGIVDR